MEQKLIESEYIWLGNARYKTQIFQTMKPFDKVSYSFEVIFDNDDKIILDDDDFSGLKKQIQHVLPIAYYSRVVAKMNMNTSKT
jgi:hypothetical protein